MQRDNVRMAVVIDEYGSVAGLVTIEDLIEEIVGELRDEDETDIVREGEHTYVVPGSMDVDRLKRTVRHAHGRRTRGCDRGRLGE